MKNKPSVQLDVKAEYKLAMEELLLPSVESQQDTNLVLDVPNIRDAESIYVRAVDLIPYYLDAIHNDKPDEFYNGILEMSDGLDYFYPNEELKELVEYDIHCGLCEKAVSTMRDSLLTAYTTTKLRDLMTTHEIVGARLVDNESVVLSLVSEHYPKEPPTFTWEDNGTGPVAYYFTKMMNT